MHACEHIGYIILGKHDLFYSGEFFGLVFLHPQDLGSRESGKGYICRVFGKLVLTYDLVQIIRLLLRTPVIPKYGGADHFVVLIKHYESVHLSAEGNTGDFRGFYP